MWIHMCAWVTRLVHTCGLKHTDADMWMSHTTDTHMWTDAHKPIWINESSVNPKSISDQSSNPCTVLQYPSRKVCACDAHMWISHRCEWVTGVNESQEWMCHRCTGVNESQVWMSHRCEWVTGVNESQVHMWQMHTCKCNGCTHVDKSQVWTSHRCEWVTRRPRSFLGAGFRSRIHPCIWCVPWAPLRTKIHVSFVPICVSRGWYPLDFSGRVRHPLHSKQLFVRMTGEHFAHVSESHTPTNHECGCVTHVNVTDAHMRMSHTCSWVTHANESRTWLSYTCNECTHVNVTDAHMWMSHTCEWVKWEMWMSHTYECVTHVNESHICE